VGSSGTVQYENTVPVMNYMFKSGFSNADRMVISHSTAASNWGLQYQDAGDKFNFLAGGAGVLTADLGTQRVGIGTISPQKKLHVFAGTSGAVTNGGTQILMEDDASSYLEMSTPDAFENGILSSNTGGIRGGVVFGASENIQLRTGGNTPRLTIDNAGYTGINRTPVAGSTFGTLQVQSTSTSDDVFGIYNSTAAGRWTYFVGTDNNLYMYFNGLGPRGNWNNATGVYTNTSDKRLKKDFTNYNYGLNTVMALQPSKYHYLDGKSTDPLSVGFMAQDVLKVYPEAVYSNIDKNGKQFYTMDYQSFSVLSIKAIQEQQQIIDKQQKQIDDLLKRVEKLEQK
jgi:Chaperone of endosialidase